MKNNLKLGLVGFVLAGIGVLYSNNSNSQNNQSQDFVKRDTITHDYAEYKYGKFGFEIETEEIIALDTNRNGINDNVIRLTVNKKLFGRKKVIYEAWIDSNEDKIFDEYELSQSEFNFLGKEKYSGKIFYKDTAEINKAYALPKFDGKKFEWNNNASNK